MAINSDPQLRLDEQALDDDDLEALLDQWADAKDALRGPRERYALLQGQVKGELAEVEPGDYRCGKYRIRIGESEPKTVEFERRSTKRITIKLFAED